jgi:hypothetical protein
MISLDTINYALHSIEIKDAGGDALAIGADGSLNVTDNGGSLTVDAVNLDIRDLAFATDKVDVSGSSVTVTATDLDIRDLSHTQDSVKVGDGTDFLAIDASGNIGVTDAGGSLTVDAVNLDIRDLAFATDKVDVSGSSVSISGTVTVSATDFDIRDLSHSQDSVKIGDGTDFLAVNADGSLNVQTFEGAYASWSVVAASVSTTESQLAASPLSGRLRIEIQNLGSNDIYIRQSTGVSTANGLKIPKGSSYEQALDAGAAIYAIANSGTADIRIAQYAA